MRATACYHRAGHAAFHSRPSGGADPSRPSLALAKHAQSVEHWVELAQAGDLSAFEELYRRHVGRVHALCLRMCGDAREAEELTQDAFVRAWQKLDSFRGSSAFASWLHRLTVNVVLGSWRRRGRHRERVVSIADLQNADPGHRPQPRLAMDLESAIAGLPAGARTVFVLHDVEGYRHRDIAEMTGLAVGTSKTQLHRARRLLRKALAK